MFDVFLLYKLQTYLNYYFNFNFIPHYLKLRVTKIIYFVLLVQNTKKVTSSTSLRILHLVIKQKQKQKQINKDPFKRTGSNE